KQLSLGRVNEDSRVMRIGNQNIAVVADSDSGRSPLDDGGCGPSPQVVAVAIEDLNAAGEIDNVQQVLVQIDGDGARTQKLTGGQTRAPPGQLQTTPRPPRRSR